MKKFIKDYIKVIAMAITGLVFVIASFYLIMNYNHSEELKKTFYIADNDNYYQKHMEILSRINNNLITYRNSNSDNVSYKTMYDSLSICYDALQSEGTFSKITPNNYYTSYELFNLGSNFQNNVMNYCYVSNLYYLKTDKVLEGFETIAPLVTSYVDSINNNVEDSLSEIKNNSSYFYSTSITSAAVRNYLSSSYKTIASSYNDFASVIEYLSNYINNNNGGSND